MPFYSP